MMRGRNNGAAVVMAMLIVALATALASHMAYQQFSWLLLAGSLNRYSQAAGVTQAALDWGRLLLYEDATSGGPADYIGEEWSKPMLSIPVEGGDVSGQITDQQALFNINNLVRDGKPSQPDIQAFQRILAMLQLPAELANTATDWIDDNNEPLPGGAEDSYYMQLDHPYRAANQAMIDLNELYRVKGFDNDAISKLRPFVTALPAPAAGAGTQVNVNTASIQVLAAILPAVPRDKLQAALDRRNGQPYQTTDEFWQTLRLQAPSMESPISVGSNFFLEKVSVRLGKQQMVSEALFQRDQGKMPQVLWQKQDEN